MPYNNELASKASHTDIIKNPEVAQFLADCDYVTPPSPEEGEAVAARFQVPPSTQDAPLPEQVIAIDGSPHQSTIYKHLPSTEIAYVKIGAVLIDMKQFRSLREPMGRFVDPFRVAKLHENNRSVTFTLPGSNVRMKGKSSVRDSFRAVVDEHLSSIKTRFNADDPKTSLRTTLFYLASLRPGIMSTDGPTKLKIFKCPNCGNSKYPIEVEDIPDAQHCPSCGGEVYPTDCLRLWEEISDYQSNAQAVSRFMMQVEHMMPIHYIRYLLENSLPSLSATAFFVDGPLAVFGNGAWLHGSIMKFLHSANQKLNVVGCDPILMIGLQKTGFVVDHVSLIERFVPSDRIFAIDDDYRYRYISMSREKATNGFGSETYYGQDFIYRTASGRSFVFALPYPFASKNNEDNMNFIEAKTDFGIYKELPRALSLIKHFESDLFDNAVVPIALAHRYTAISLVPGGQILDLLTRQALGTK